MSSLGSYIIKNERIYFTTRYNSDFISDVKEIVGRKYDMDKKCWDAPISFSSSTQVKALIEKYELVNLSVSNTGSPENDIILLNDIETVLDQRIPSLNEQLEALQQSKQLLLYPRPYQIRGIAYNLISKRCINGSEQGTGKTFTTIFTIELENLFPCVAVVPSSVKYNWEKQWKRVNPNRSVSVIENKDSDFTADVLIMTYNAVGKKIIEKVKDEEKEKIIYKYEQMDGLLFKSFIADESQYLKNNTAIRTKAIKKLSKKIDYRFLLTGTAIMNRPVEIITPLGIISQFDSIFGNWRDFVYRYCGATETQYGIDTSGATNTLELNQKLRQQCYFRVQKREVLTELPDMEETILNVDISNEKEYKSAEVDLISYIRRKQGQLKADSAENAEQLVLINTLRKLSADGKMNELIEWLDDFLESSTEKLVVAGLYVENIKLLSKKYKCDHLIGDVNPKKRQEIVDDFQVNSKRILFMNMLTGGVGVDGLQFICSNMMVYELPWRWTDVDQLTSRIDRDGQEHKMSIYYLLGNCSIDDKMWKMLLKKRKVTDQVNAHQEVYTQKYMQDLIEEFI